MGSPDSCWPGERLCLQLAPVLSCLSLVVMFQFAGVFDGLCLLALFLAARSAVLLLSFSLFLALVHQLPCLVASRAGPRALFLIWPGGGHDLVGTFALPACAAAIPK